MLEQSFDYGVKSSYTIEMIKKALEQNRPVIYIDTEMEIDVDKALEDFFWKG